MTKPKTAMKAKRQGAPPAPVEPVETEEEKRERAHVPTQETRRQVETLTGFGLTQEQIAAVLKITDRTLRKHYRSELDTGVLKANAAVADALFKKALGIHSFP